MEEWRAKYNPEGKLETRETETSQTEEEAEKASDIQETRTDKRAQNRKKEETSQ